MFLKTKYHKNLIFTLFLFILVNCQIHESKNTHGIVFLENRSNKLIIDKTNKNDVLNIIGHPHSKSIDNENEWFYIERVLVKGDYHKLGRNILKTNNVLLLQFNKYGILKNKQMLKKEDIEKVSFAENITSNEITQKSFVEKFLSSLKAKMYGKK